MSKRGRWSNEILQFTEITGDGSSGKALSCLEATNGDLQRALDLYFNQASSVPTPVTVSGFVTRTPAQETRLSGGSRPSLSVVRPAERPAESSAPSFRYSTSKFIGCLEPVGSLTTRLLGVNNKLSKGQLLDITMNAKITSQAMASGWNKAKKLKKDLDNSEINLLVYGSPIIRFAQTCDVSEVGRLPSDYSSFLYPLALLGLIDFKVSVRSDGYSGTTLQPGASVPLKVDLYLADRKQSEALRELNLSAVELETLHDKLRICWKSLFSVLALFPSMSGDDLTDRSPLVDTPDSVEKNIPDDSVDNDEASGSEEVEMSESVKSFLGDIFARIDLPLMSLPTRIFTSTLKPYQQQALYWMCSREMPIALGGLPASLGECVFSALSSSVEEIASRQPDDVQALPQGWAQYHIPDGSAFYMHEATGEILFDPPSITSTHGLCLGGILADEMGLGKTVMALSLVASDKLRHPPTRPVDDNKIYGGTLVVVPLSLMRQWKIEAEQHAGINALEYYGTGRQKNPQYWANAEMVLTTYGTFALEAENSPLAKIHWKRIFLDEAHFIKNRSTKANRAVKMLLADYKWCLTGTPMQNGLTDIFPLISWLGVQPWSSYAYFQRHVIAPMESGNRSEASATVRKFLGPIMIRRTKNTNDRDGKPLLVLPPRTLKTLWLKLDTAEEDFYSALFWQTRLKFDQYVANNSVMMHYTHVLQLIMKLRQALCHPLLCVKGDSTDQRSNETPTQQEASSVEELVSKFLEQQSVGAEYAKSLLDNLKKHESAECPICVEEVKHAVITPCGHIMCKPCAISALRQMQGLCPMCRSEAPESALVEVPEDRNNAAGFQHISQPIFPSTKMRTLLRYLKRDVLKRGRRVVVFSQFVSFLDMIASMLNETRIAYRMLHGGHSLEQRRKVVDWLKDDNDYSPLISESALDAADDSELSEDEEGASDKKRVGKVLLVSLKAGGVGLNLVAASSIYLLDLWWNPAVEDQALQRVHRIGQLKRVRAYKLVITNSMDSKILDLQNKKSAIIDGTLGQGGSDLDSLGNMQTLSLDDLKQLFKPRETS